MTPARRSPNISRSQRTGSDSAVLNVGIGKGESIVGLNELLPGLLADNGAQANKTTATFASTSASRAWMPTVSNDGANGFTPATETNPCDGRKPQIPQLLAGTRVEPPRIRSERKIHQTAGNRRSRSARRSTRYAIGRPRVERRAVKVILTKKTESQFVRNSFPDAAGARAVKVAPRTQHSRLLWDANHATSDYHNRS